MVSENIIQSPREGGKEAVIYSRSNYKPRELPLWQDIHEHTISDQSPVDGEQWLINWTKGQLSWKDIMVSIVNLASFPGKWRSCHGP